MNPYLRTSRERGEPSTRKTLGNLEIVSHTSFLKEG